MKKNAVLGVGNPLDGKDSIGLAVAEKLARILNWKTVYTHTAGLEVMDILLPFDRVIAVDTVLAIPAGEVVVYTPDSQPVSVQASHAISILDTLTIGRALYGRQFPRCLVAGIGLSGSDGSNMDVDKIAKKIISAVQGYRGWWLK